MTNEKIPRTKISFESEDILDECQNIFVKYYLPIVKAFIPIVNKACFLSKNGIKCAANVKTVYSWYLSIVIKKQKEEFW